MSAWINLVRKELRLGLVAFLVPIIAFFVLIGLVGYIASFYDHTWEAIGITALVVTGFQAFYLAYYLLISLQSEQKRLHLWIHSPMPGYGLLSAKLVAGIISFLITFLITSLTIYIAYNMSIPDQLMEQLQMYNISDFAIMMATHIFLGAISIGFVFLFFWMIYLVLKTRYPSFISFCITFILFMISSLLFGTLMETPFFEALTMWGEIPLNGIREAAKQIENTSNAVVVGTFSLYAGNYVFEVVFVAVLFISSCWMLDRKVEV